MQLLMVHCLPIAIDPSTQGTLWKPGSVAFCFINQANGEVEQIEYSKEMGFLV